MDIIFELIGYFAGICTAISFVPQAVKTFKTRDIRGLSLGMYTIFNMGIMSWVIYGFYMHSYQMMIFNLICLTFSFPIWVMILKYRKKTD